MQEKSEKVEIDIIFCLKGLIQNIVLVCGGISDLMPIALD